MRRRHASVVLLVSAALTLPTDAFASAGPSGQGSAAVAQYGCEARPQARSLSPGAVGGAQGGEVERRVDPACLPPLPFTGLSVLPMFAVGAGLVASGALIRRRVAV